ncbi:MAG: ATP-binding cassette domain-containing protein [Anaerolineales bacterium]|nr:ATP-binding cassette domain-containing protein [Anaerolineales bacterium]
MSDVRLPYSRHRHADPVLGAPAVAAELERVHYPGAATPALHEIRLTVPVGARVALVGSNGAGKSTLLKAIAGLLPIRAGALQIYGRPVGDCRHRVAYLPQRSDLDWRFPADVRRLVMTGRYVHLGWLQRPGKQDRAIVDAQLERLGLAPLAERQIGELSGGQQQRALLARALAQDADLLLLDEPLNAVDADTRAVMAQVLNDLARGGKTVIAATHDLGRLEAEFDGALYLCEGREAAPPPGSFTGLRLGNAPLETAAPLKAAG